MQYKTFQLDEFLNRVNAYRLSYLDKSITGRLIEVNDEYLKIQLRSGDMICCRLDCLESIWYIRQPNPDLEAV